MTNRIEELYNQLVQEWRIQVQGKGTINFGPNVNPLPVVLGVLYAMYARDPTQKVLILVNNNETRQKVINYLTGTEIPANNEQFKLLIDRRIIKILSIDIAKTWACSERFNLLITVGVNYYDNTLNNFIYLSKFKLICLTADSPNKEVMYNHCPLVKTFAINEIIELSNNSPVEEYRVGITIDKAEDVELLERYDNYIKQSITIFGSFDNIKLAINGEPKVNLSAIQYCTDLARANGWDESLDMSVEHNKQIDSYFNPIALQERAKLTYDIRIKRSKLLSDNNSKLDAILKICEENTGKKILIINKTSDFAKEVTNYLNSHLQHYCNGKRFYDACYNYHEDVDDMYDLDDNGERIKVKSGKLKGTYKIIKGKAQKSRAVDYFNRDYTNILSANNAPDRALQCDLDLLIITSPLCDTIKEYRYRLLNVNFDKECIKVFKLYCIGTLEERNLTKEQPGINHKIFNNCEKGIEFDENLGSAIVI